MLAVEHTVRDEQKKVKQFKGERNNRKRGTQNNNRESKVIEIHGTLGHDAFSFDRDNSSQIDLGHFESIFGV